MSPETLQIIITIAGVCSQLILLAREITKLVDVTSKEDGGAATKRPPATILAKIQQGKSILDLSFVVLCAAFFSLLTTDSLIVSGRNPATGPFYIFLVILITFVYVTIMVTAWYINKTEKVTGFLAIITLTVLIISPGGPFNKEQPGSGESGLNIFLIVPVIALITIAATMLIYSFGNPLSRSVNRRSRVAVFLTLMGVGIFAAIAIGTQIDDYIAKDERTPKFSSPEIKDFARSVMQQNTDEKRDFYRFASEICLTEFYQNQYYNSQPAQINESYALAPTTPNPLPVISTTTKLSNSTASASPAPSPLPVSSAISAEQIRQIEKKTIDDLRREYIESSREIPFSEFLDQYYRKKINESGRSGRPRLDLLVGKFTDSLETTQKSAMLKERLLWIHPAGFGSNSEAVITLPDKTAEKRLNIISNYRITTTLHDQEKQRKELFVEFSYPDEVRNYYMDEAERIQRSRQYYRYYDDDQRSIQNNFYYKPNLFPPTSHTNNNLQVANLLKEQLSLPLEAEAGIAFQEYKAFAAQQVKQQIKNEKIASWLTALAQLNQKSQQALYYGLVKQNNVEIEKVLALLSKLKANGTDFKNFISSDDPVKVRKIREQLTSNPPNIDEKLKPLANKLSELDANDKKTLATLLETAEFSYTGPSFPVEYLFTDTILNIVDEINHNLETGQQKEFLTAVLDPVWYSTKALSNNQGEIQSTQNTKNPITLRLEKFRNFSHDDQENILHQLAISLYQPGGIHSFDPIRLLIAQVRFWSDNAGWVCATILCIPFLIAFTLLGAFFARLLVTRDRMREVVASEHSGFADVRNTLGTPVDLFGRETLLRTLKNLAERGWSTIGVVGRRGVGKSRVLHALSTSPDDSSQTDNSDDKTALSIRVWVSSPSKFSEEEFISSIYERLAMSTESAIANFLGAKPLATRTIENKMAISSTWAYGAALLLWGIIVYYMSNRLSRTDIVTIWVPILALVFTSIGLFAHYITKLQPVNLTSWLQREKSQNPHTYLLYRDVYKVLLSLNLNSYEGQSKEAAKGVSGIGKSIVLGILIFTIAATTLWLVIAVANPYVQGSGVIMKGAIIVLSGLILLWLYYFRKTERIESGNWASGQTLMSLMINYRTFASTVVYRLNRGALNYGDESKFTILVCIDELDKIVDFEEIRAFIRRIKAIFEIPGLYYYISIAEDTLRALYLGAVTGKNEVDSAFDHIVRVPALTCTDGEKIAQTYLQKSLNDKQLPPRIGRLIATLAFGVPRDIIRRCDEFIRDKIEESEQPVGNAHSPYKLVKNTRSKHLNLAYELQQLNGEQIEKLNREPAECVLAATEVIEALAHQESATRLVLLIWLLALTEIAVEDSEDQKWKDVSEKINDYGYKLSDAPLSDLLVEMQELHHSFFMESVKNVV
jgi:hypothetical protein